jgi:hypothetical protein
VVSVTGRRRNDARDLHDRFAAWLVGDRSAPLGRDVAVHAAVCAACRQAIAAVDTLGMVDIGALSLPEMPADTGPAVRAPARTGQWRLAASAVVVLLVASSAAALSGGLFRAPGAENLTPTPGQGVLGGTGTPGSTPSGSEEASFGAIGSGSDVASPSTESTGTATGAPLPPGSAPISLPSATPSRPAAGSPTASPTGTLGPTPTPSATQTSPASPSAPASEPPSSGSVEASPSVEPSASGS